MHWCVCVWVWSMLVRPLHPARAQCTRALLVIGRAEAGGGRGLGVAAAQAPPRRGRELGREQQQQLQPQPAARWSEACCARMWGVARVLRGLRTWRVCTHCARAHRRTGAALVCSAQASQQPPATHTSAFSRQKNVCTRCAEPRSRSLARHFKPTPPTTAMKSVDDTAFNLSLLLVY